MFPNIAMIIIIYFKALEMYLKVIIIIETLSVAMNYIFLLDYWPATACFKMSITQRCEIP